MIKRILGREYVGSISSLQLHPLQWLGSNTNSPTGYIYSYPIKWNDFLPDNWRTL